MTDVNWIDAALTAARPQALGALLRYFRDLDTAEEAFQDACVRALKNWPRNGPPRDPAAWLILVGRNVAIDEVRRRKRHEPLPPEVEAIIDGVVRRGDAPRFLRRLINYLVIVGGRARIHQDRLLLLAGTSHLRQLRRRQPRVVERRLVRVYGSARRV